MSKFILQLSDTDATIENVGGKGNSLAKLTQAGLPVPRGFHVTTQAYRQFVAANGLQSHIMAAMDTADIARPASLEAASQQIAGLFAAAEMPKEIAEAIRFAYADLKGVPVAVRSSATAEDLPETSFAGQQETYLNVCGEEAVLESVKLCWSSLWTGRAISYRLKNNVDQGSVALAVVVQELVPAEASGVMFTANPFNGQRDEIVINAAWGLGAAVVSGTVTPDMITVSKLARHPIRRETATKEVMTVRAETGTIEQPVPDAKKNTPALSDEQVTELVNRGIQVETLYKMPMDIEWALAGGKFAVLQARPITALPEAPMEWKLPDPKGLYLRASLIEQMPEPLTPLFSTLSGPIIEEATRRLFTSMAGGKGLKQELRLFATINDYGYMNLNFGMWNTMKIALGQMMKMNWIFKQSQSRWQQVREHYLVVIHEWQARSLDDYTASELLTGIRSLFYETMEVYTVLQTGLVATAIGSETMFSQLYNRMIKKKDDPDASIFIMGFESMPIRAEQSLYDLAEWAKSRSVLASHLTSTPAAQLATELERTDIPAGLDGVEWNEWQRRFREHLSIYGHFTYDLDFSKAVAADDPAPLLETFRMYLMGKAGSPYIRVKTLSNQREQATQTIMKRLHKPLRSIFRRQLQSAQKYAPLREDGLSDLGLGYPLLRKLSREFGRRLVKEGAVERSEDIFWLTESEVNDAAAALDQDRSLPEMMATIHDRQVVWKAEQVVSPPIVLPVGSKYIGMDVEKLTSGGLTNDPNVIKGFGCSQGKVTAPARILFGPQDFNQLRLGDVLVAPLTTPAWTPLFALASAIVTDIGGPLSHSSIVAREYGIPAVLGTGVATRRIRGGQTITVDGSAGIVTCQPSERESSCEPTSPV